MNTIDEVLSGKPSLLDNIEAGLLSREDFERELVNQVYAGLHRYCEIPAGYSHCQLVTTEMDIEAMGYEPLRTLLRHPPAEIINPYPSHIKAIELFQLLLSGDSLVCENGDPLNPTVGAYLYGPPGTGKTHLMAAFALRIQSMLNKKLQHVRHMLGDEVENAFGRYTKRQASEVRETESVSVIEVKDGKLIPELSPVDEFWDTVKTFQGRLKNYQYQPTDLLYLGFKELIEVCKYSTDRSDAFRALETARLVFIDDVHPQGDPEQIQIVLHLLERRYELGRAGTFITTNLDTREISGGDDILGNRLLSRCAETLVSIDFSDCDDWRQQVKGRRIKLIENELDKRIQTHKHLDPE
jgi:DNA replication protein DnaC